MRICLTSDWHVDRRIGGHDRRDETVEFRGWLVDECGRSDVDVDLVVHPGDWADPGKDELVNQVRIAEDCCVLSHLGRLGLVTIPGNHDVVLGTENLSTLSPLEVHNLSWPKRGRTTVCSRPGPISIEGSPRLLFIAAPYPHDTRDFHDSDGHYHRALRNACEMARDMNGVERVVVVSHLYLRRVLRDELACSDESDEMCRGDDCYLPDYVIDVADIVLQGHYHRKQHLWALSESGATAEVYIPGSPIRHTFGERDDAQKGVWFIDV